MSVAAPYCSSAPCTTWHQADTTWRTKAWAAAKEGMHKGRLGWVWKLGAVKQETVCGTLQMMANHWPDWNTLEDFRA
jgi:hypothetical protein